MRSEEAVDAEHGEAFGRQEHEEDGGGEPGDPGVALGLVAAAAAVEATAAVSRQPAWGPGGPIVSEGRFMCDPPCPSNLTM